MGLMDSESIVVELSHRQPIDSDSRLRWYIIIGTLVEVIEKTVSGCMQADVMMIPAPLECH